MKAWIIGIGIVIAFAAALLLHRVLATGEAPPVRTPVGVPGTSAGPTETELPPKESPGAGDETIPTTPPLPPDTEPPWGYGGIPPAGSPADAGVAGRGDRASLREAIAQRTNPERLVPNARPTPFDPAAFARAPAAWLKVIEPGRIYLRAKPGPGVARIAAAATDLVHLAKDGTCELAVRVPPGAPVTFHAHEYGRFANGLATLSVRADAGGVARVTLRAPADTVGNGHVSAASPLAVGGVDFLVRPAEQAPGGL